MLESKPMIVPLRAQFRLSSALCPKKEHGRSSTNKIPYASAIGSVMFAMICTQPNLACSMILVAHLCQILTRNIGMQLNVF